MWWSRQKYKFPAISKGSIKKKKTPIQHSDDEKPNTSEMLEIYGFVKETINLKFPPFFLIIMWLIIVH